MHSSQENLNGGFIMKTHINAHTHKQDISKVQKKKNLYKEEGISQISSTGLKVLLAT
jgi:flagellar biosynthesis/type III secretory pathway chaperone